MNRSSAWITLLLILLPSAASGQFYVGALGGFATLSADARSVIGPAGAAFSLYKPENGPSVGLFAGRHLTDYLSLQVSYGWNRNDILLSATSTSSAGQTLYQEARSSSEESILGEALVYFRNRRSWVRPYLSVGTGPAWFHSRETRISALRGMPALPPREFSSVAAALPVAVGIDLTIRGRWGFHYTFRETNRDNPVSAVLSPPGQRDLKTYENLFGLVKAF